MIIQMRELAVKGNPIQFHEQIVLSELIQRRNDIHSANSPLAVDLVARHENGSVIVEGQLNTELEFVCARCLCEFREKLSIPFHEEFVRNTEANSETDEDEVNVVSEDRVDIRPYVEMNFWLALPFIPLCEEDCKGLCPACGTNRNDKLCDCDTEPVDVRLAGLKDFFDKA